ncbi:hypothetical protein ACLI4Z_03915 [Natrialbaceae archaeon A-arb3/5]
MNDDSSDVSRRRLLRASAATVALSTVGTGQVAASTSDRDAVAELAFDRRCPDATIRPSMDSCEGASTDGCSDDHPATRGLRDAVRETLTERYPDVGALVDAGFKPYFDTLDVADEEGWSHWLHPEYIGDEEVLDPARPESVLVDNDTWRSIGVMFIATRGGEPVDPPAVYEDGDESGVGSSDDDGSSDEHGHDGSDDAHGHGHDGSDDDHEHPGADDNDGHCAPWHYHAGLPGRFAWWFYQRTYDPHGGDGDVRFPCRTPCMMHVWTVDHPDGVYAHGGPPAEYRDQQPADDPGFDTDARPGEDELGWATLPEDLAPDRTPDEFAIPGLR